MYVQFKKELGDDYEAKLKNEFYHQIDLRLQAIILMISLYCFMKWRVYTIITCLNRTKEENKKVNGSQYSAHLFGRAVDLRTSHLEQQQIDSLIKWVGTVWGDFIYVLYHDAGSGNHLHLNIRYKYRRSQFERNEV